ncbi:retrovirus-related Pol polyprotein from transposon opus [Trichonephila inaurata madagascariensis]|uniref:Retrovirus-related Pol polyprotein from transposon opus n=1 Tax=Trichonephila inaurata madagascariensis TaxID=2747483 RepID=A0A8X6YB96_9ARAC|nr:retrovirus-related Pol polyprotein from transposon opus [Trichonephila inaurata madagascariensis]
MICSDQGTNFTSNISEAFLSVMGVSPRFSIQGHPEMYGLLPSEPISLLKEVWAGERNIPTTVSRSLEKYQEDLTEKLRKAHEIAAETAEATQNNYESYYIFMIQGKAIQGSATIIEITRPYSAKVEFSDGGIRELHFNKLRPYIARVVQVGLIFDQDSDFRDLHYAPTDTGVTSMVDVTDHISSVCQELEMFSDWNY